MEKTIDLVLKRLYFKNKYTIGKLFIDRKYFCDTLEDRRRDLSVEDKVYGETAIPEGKYKIILTKSTRFGRVLPEILNVPGFVGVRMHSGNVAADSEGCILLGFNTVQGMVLKSRHTEIKLVSLLYKFKNIKLTIV